MFQIVKLTRYIEKNMARSKKKPHNGWVANSVQNIDMGNNIYAGRARKIDPGPGTGSQRKRHSQRNIFFDMEKHVKK